MLTHRGEAVFLISPNLLPPWVHSATYFTRLTYLLRPKAALLPFADATAVLTVHEDPAEATYQLQVHLNKIHSWL
jgi:hypothetical protein